MAQALDRKDSNLDVVVVGAGFSGCYLLHLLRNKGFKTKVLESASTIGGVWAWNRYPGARVDHEMPWYGFSDPAIWGAWTWTERFPSDTTLRAYFQHVANVWNLHADIELKTKVTSAAYNDAMSRWLVETEPGKTYCCKWLITAVGTSSERYIPEWRGQERFEGVFLHSSLWPEKQVPIEGKRVAIVGAGASGIQIMQETAQVCSRVTQFIRTPNIALPMRQRQITEEEIYAQKPLFTHIFRACRDSANGLPILNTGKAVFEDSAEDREVLFEELWKRGGFNFAQGSYNDYLINPEANRELYNFWCKKTRARIQDPTKRDLLAPLEPPYHFATKRPSLEHDYYEACDSPNVEITDAIITEFTETGIVTKDGKHREFDIVAVCTGYDAITGGLKAMSIRGRNGLGLDEKWKDGVITNLGMTVNGFPNFFTVYGPQAPTSTAIGPIFAEMQCEWVLEVLTRQQAQRIRTVEADRKAEQAWRKEVLDLANKTLLVETDSWAMGANVPGKRRECLLYLGGMPAYFLHCQQALESWKGFETHSEA